MSLIGYTFFASQNDFESWQVENPSYKVCSVAPQLMSMNIADKGKYELDMNGKTAYGVFVTYRYDKEVII